MLHEGVAREFGVALAALLRCPVEVSLADLDRRTYGEFLESLSEPACFHVLKAAPVEDRLLLDIEPSILHPMIDYLLGGGRVGGKGDRSNLPERPGGCFAQIGPVPFSASRPLSEIEWRLTARIVHLLLEEICRAWKDTVELKLDVVQVESNPRQLRVLPTDEAVVQVGFEISIGREPGMERGMMRLCLPCRAIGRMSEKWTPDSLAAHDGRGPEAMVKMSVALAETRIAGNELDNLRPGDIVTTETASDSPAIVSIDGQASFCADLACMTGARLFASLTPSTSARRSIRNRPHLLRLPPAKSSAASRRPGLFM